MMRARFDHAEVLAEGIRRFWFTPERQLDQIAGQFIELTIDHPADDRGNRRWFTVSSPPGLANFAVTTRLMGKDGSSFKRALASLKPGDSVYASDPMGDFVLPRGTTVPLVLVAAGIGITPVMSMLSWLSSQPEAKVPRITLLHAIRSENETTEHFIPPEDLMLTTHHAIIENPSDSWRDLQGRLSAELVLNHTTDPQHSLFYLSGPETLVEELARGLQASGVNARQLVSDSFTGYGARL